MRSCGGYSDLIPVNGSAGGARDATRGQHRGIRRRSAKGRAPATRNARTRPTETKSWRGAPEDGTAQRRNSGRRSRTRQPVRRRRRSCDRTSDGTRRRAWSAGGGISPPSCHHNRQPTSDRRWTFAWTSATRTNRAEDPGGKRDSVPRPRPSARTRGAGIRPARCSRPSCAEVTGYPADDATSRSCSRVSQAHAEQALDRP